MDGLKPYPAYKDSGLPWLGRVPEHWEMRRTKVLFRERVERDHPEEPLLAATQSKGVVRKEDYGSRTVTAQKDFHLLKLVEVGDFVISLRSFEGGIEVAHCRGIISPAYTVLEPRTKYVGEYFRHFFKSPDFISSLTLFVTGIREGQNIDYERLSRAFMPLPPREEQATIVRYLDHATRKIDQAIRAKRKIIALLNEQKLAIIHRAVTRGLDPDVPLKDSGIPWLGKIPAHWDVRPLKQLLIRMDYGTSENARGEGVVRVLTMGHIRDGAVVMPDRGSLDSIPEGLSLQTNDLLFNRTNSAELVGKVGVFSGPVSDDITFASYLVRLRVKPEHSPYWLNYLLNSARFWSYARSQALVSLHQANLNPTRYGQMLLPVPSRVEQDRIVDQVLLQAGEIETTASSVEREIALLREYRTRLIADVVTGKLDVRKAAAQLPEPEVEEAPEAIEVEDDEEVLEEAA